MSHTAKTTLAEFSRDALEQSAQPAELCAALEARLFRRLAGATDRAAEAAAIIDELRASGHEAWSWDESIDFTIWGDDYMNPPRPTRLLIEMSWPSEVEPTAPVEVAVTFGRWPRR